jgi:hypothetical protein
LSVEQVNLCQLSSPLVLQSCQVPVGHLVHHFTQSTVVNVRVRVILPVNLPV